MLRYCARFPATQQPAVVPWVRPVRPAKHWKCAHRWQSITHWGTRALSLTPCSDCELLRVCRRSFKTSSNISDMSAFYCFATPNTAPRPINVIFNFKAWKCNDYRVFPVDTSLPSDSYIVWLQHWARWTWPRQCTAQKNIYCWSTLWWASSLN